MMFNPDDYAQMKWRIEELAPSVRIIEKYPDLENIFREYLNDLATNELSADVVMRYIVLCYDKYSPFVRKISNIGQRKTAAWKTAGADPTLTDARDISSGVNKDVALAIMQFLQFQMDANYLTLTYRTEAYHRLNIEMSSGGAKFSKAMFESLREMEKDIERLSDSVFRGDRSLLDVFPVAQIYANRKLSPEENSQ